MSTLADRWNKLWQTVKGAPTFTPTRIDLPASRVDPAPREVKPFEAGGHYFQVRVNRLFLANGREWLTKFDPLVWTVTNALYDKQTQSVPCVIGPTKFQQERPAPHGMVVKNTRVAGLYPFRGGRLTLTVVLCKVERDNFGPKILGLVESVAAALDFSTAVTSYVKVGKAVLEGVETLTGNQGTTALVGERIGYDLDAGDVIAPMYRALVNARCDSDKFWVKDNELCVGDTLAEATPYTDADYVLYEIARTDLRSDVEELPFFPLFERVKEEAARGGKESWKQAKANMLTLYQALVLSPDVTKAQRDLLITDFMKEMQEIRKNATGIQFLAGVRDPEERAELDNAVGILDL